MKEIAGIGTENWFTLILNLAQTGYKMTPELQNAIAQYISYSSNPIMTISSGWVDLDSNIHTTRSKKYPKIKEKK